MSAPFDLLSPNLQRTVFELGWQAFRPIQAMAIPAILGGEDDVILVAATASGKTEAAFLPILSQVEPIARTQVAVLYISPLKALINDQHERIAQLCRHTGVAVHRRHGDVGAADKRRLLTRPTGIVQITPESIESLLLNRSEHVRALFGGLRFVVVDELHAFVGSARGVQLRSLLHRLTAYTQARPRHIGLSATLGDPAQAQAWLNPGSPQRVQLLVDESDAKPTRLLYRHFPAPDIRFPQAMIEDLLRVTARRTTLLFADSRSRVEALVRDLNRLRSPERPPFYAHHASVAQAGREAIEADLKRARTPQAVVATGTLELGIDIGALDLVVQIDSTYSVDSLTQRLGRSGRRETDARYLAVYTTSEEQLVQSVAVIELMRAGRLERRSPLARPYDVLWQQLIALANERSGIGERELAATMRRNPAFAGIPAHALSRLIADMVEADQLQRLAGSETLIVGLAAERILRSRDFYAVFTTLPELSVYAGDQLIGRLPANVDQAPGVRFLLAGRIWEIRLVDARQQRVYVREAPGGRVPLWLGPMPEVAHSVRTEMARLLSCADDYPYLPQVAREILATLRRARRQAGLGEHARGVTCRDRHAALAAFAGDKVANTLAAALALATGAPFTVEGWGRIATHHWPGGSLVGVIRQLARQLPSEDELLGTVGDERLAHLETRFAPYLPRWAQQQLYAETVFDWEGTRAFLQAVEWVEVEG